MTPEAYRDLTRAAMRPVWRKASVFSATVFGLSATICYLLYTQTTSHRIDVFVAGLTGGAGFGVAISFLGFIRGQVRQLMTAPLDPANAKSFESRVVTIDEDGFSSSYSNGSTSFASWGMVVGWSEADGFIRLHFNRMYSFIIASDAFEGEGRAFLDGHLAKIPKIKDIPTVRR